MLYHIVVEDRQKVGWPVHDWLPEVSALCCMEVLPYCSLAMRRRYPAEGEYVRRFGDRDDGHLLRSLFCIFAVSPYLMKTGTSPKNYIRDAVEIARAEQDIPHRSGRRGWSTSACCTCGWRSMCERTSVPGPGDRGEHDRQKGDVPGHGHQAPVRPSDTADVVLSAVQCQSPGGEERLGGHPLRCAGPARSIWRRVCC